MVAPIEDYLANWAEPITRPDFKARTSTEIHNLARINACRSGRFRWALVVPVFDEAPDCIDTLLQNLNFANGTNNLLVIRIVNAPDDATAAEVTRTRAALADSAGAAPERVCSGVQMLTLDAVSKPLPANQATGLARKLGNDIACQLINQGHIATPVLCNTDADAILPADYFARITRASAETTSTAAWILPFEHSSPNLALQQAGTTYELYLRALQLNLQRCGSPYAFPALGSVLAIDPTYYAKSRGFPKRRAGEDFYLLNKLAKLADVSYLTGTPVVLAARASHRVPFGTGPAIAKLLSASQLRSDQMPQIKIDLLATYALKSFALLRQFYVGVSELEVINATDGRTSPARKLPKAWQDPDLWWLLKRLGLPAALTRLQANHKSQSTLIRAIHEWFDALKTVRFLNEARHFHADEPLAHQLEHLRTFVTTDQAAVTSQAVNISSSGDDKRWHVLSILNRDLESNRAKSRHSVALSVADCLTTGADDP